LHRRRPAAKAVNSPRGPSREAWRDARPARDRYRAKIRSSHNRPRQRRLQWRRWPQTLCFASLLYSPVSFHNLGLKNIAALDAKRHASTAILGTHALCPVDPSTLRWTLRTLTHPWRRSARKQRKRPSCSSDSTRYNAQTWRHILRRTTYIDAVGVSVARAECTLRRFRKPRGRAWRYRFPEHPNRATLWSVPGMRCSDRDEQNTATHICRRRTLYMLRSGKRKRLCAGRKRSSRLHLRTHQPAGSDEGRGTGNLALSKAVKGEQRRQRQCLK
jgi:hypothetical protein